MLDLVVILRPVHDDSWAAEALSTAESLVDNERSVIERLQAGAPSRWVSEGGPVQRVRDLRAGRCHGKVGGDWYDVFLVEDRAVLVVGDVAGHGIQSAALMSQVRNALRAYAHVDPDPARILQSLNAFGVQQWPDTFVTVLIVVLDLSDNEGVVAYASGGHLPPLLVAGPASTFLDVAGGPVVGPIRGATFTSSTIRLRPGQRLLLFTDGLVENRGRLIDEDLGQLLDQARAFSDLPIIAMCERVRDRMTARRAKEDDLCLLCIEHG